MYLKLLTENNVLLYRDMVPEALRDKDELLGVVCLDEDVDGPLGVAVVEPQGQSLNILWLYVAPEHRECGAGSLMMDGIEEMAEAAGLERVEAFYWTKSPENELSEEECGEYENRDEERILDDFLSENGFVILRETPIYSFVLGDIYTSDYVQEHNKNIDNKRMKEYVGVPFYEISEEEESYVRGQLIKNGFNDCISICSKELSFICKKDGKIEGCIIATDDPEEKLLTVAVLLNFGNDPVCAAKLIVALGEKAKMFLSHDYRVSFIAANDSVIKLVSTVLGGVDKLETWGCTSHGILEV